MNTLSIKNKEEKSFLKKTIIHKIVYFLYKYVDCIIAQSEGMKTDLINNYKIPEKNLFVLNNPIQNEIELFINNNENFNNQKENFVLCVGRLVSQKGFIYAINAFSCISNDYPKLRLKIVGVGILENVLKQQALNLNISDKIDFDGYCQNIIPYYLKAKLTILTSLYEGLPNVLIESIALGTPVVSFDCPYGPSEIIQDGVNGYLVKYLDTEDLIKCIKLAIDRQWNSDEIKKTANKFSSKKIINEYTELLLNIRNKNKI